MRIDMKLQLDFKSIAIENNKAKNKANKNLDLLAPKKNLQHQERNHLERHYAMPEPSKQLQSFPLHKYELHSFFLASHASVLSLVCLICSNCYCSEAMEFCHCYPNL